jgi:O-antigen ligase
VGNDYLLAYGVNLSNIFVVLALGAFFRELILEKGKRRASHIKKRMFLVLSCGLGFLLIALGSSLRSSAFFGLSLTWTLQYLQLFLMAFFVFYFYNKFRRRFELVFIALVASLALQEIISIWQFLKQSSIGIPIESFRAVSFYSQGLDELRNVFRVAGTFHYHNQLAFILLLLLTIILPRVLRSPRFKSLYLLGVFIGAIVIILTQSRSIWLVGALVIILFVRIYKKNLYRLVAPMGIKRFIILAVLALAGLSYIIIPRMLLSFNIFYEGAGVPIRLEMLKEAGQAFVLSPWIGYGVGTNEYVLFSLFPSGVMSFFPSAVHMGFVQLLLEVGVLGLVLFLAPFVYLLRNLLLGRFTPEKSSDQKDFRFSFIAGTLVFFLYYLFQPHVGIVEFPYLGIILGLGIAASS